MSVTIFDADLVENTPRTCGGCTLCCRLVPVETLGKKAGQRCRHQYSKGCRIHDRLPSCCQLWSCHWLVGKTSPGMLRPDRAGYVIDPMPDTVSLRSNETGAVQEVMVMQVWCDPDRPDAWRDPKLQALIDEWGRTQGMATLVRYDSQRAWAIFPGCMAADGQRREFPPGAEGTEVNPERKSWIEKEIQRMRGGAGAAR